MDLSVLRNWKFKDQTRSYGERDAMLYSLGIGIGGNQTDPDELCFVTENNLRTMPTFGVVVARLGIRECLTAAAADVVEAYHGEQRSIFDKQMPPSGALVATGRVVGVWDKGAGRGTLVEFEQDIRDAETRDRYCLLRNLTFLRRDGGCGGDDTEPPRLQPVPEEPPDAAFDMPTLKQTALIYRLSGDMNPLHSDPEVARQAGLPRPMLHGYCTYGIACWAIMRNYLDCHAGRLASLDCRFTAPAFPGETLRTEMWRAGNFVSFRVRSLERDVVVLGAGRAVLRV